MTKTGVGRPRRRTPRYGPQRYRRATLGRDVSPCDHDEIQGPVPSDWSRTPASSQVYSPPSTLDARWRSLASVLCQSRSNSASTRSAGLGAERLCQLVGRRAPGWVLGSDHLRAGTGRRHGEQLCADVDDAPQERLPVLQLRLPAAHRVERLARELARRALDVAQVPGQRAELVVRRRHRALADDELRQPAGVEAARLHRCPVPSARGRRPGPQGHRRPTGARRPPPAR